MIPSKFTLTPGFQTDGIIVGIDPGLARTGIGVIMRKNRSCICLEHQVVRTLASDELAVRLAAISNAVSEVCTRYQPRMAAIERTFINENFASSLALGQARGAALAALGVAKLAVTELAPNSVKRQLTGDSLASKNRVRQAVRMQLGLDPAKRLASDASDALAVALSCTIERQRLRRTTRQRRR